MEWSHRWARLKPLGGHGWRALRNERVGVLRRGAWYAVLNEAKTVWVVIDLVYRDVTVPKELLEFRSGPPQSFSVVALADEDPNPVRGTAADPGFLYAVCPESRDRVRLQGHPDRLQCPTCHSEFPIEWQPVC